MNFLLAKRFDPSFVPIVASTQNATLDSIKVERRKELLYRGLRWIDLKRYNKESANITLKRYIGPTEYILLPNANYYALPLPADIINQTGMAQNPH